MSFGDYEKEQRKIFRIAVFSFKAAIPSEDRGHNFSIVMKT